MFAWWEKGEEGGGEGGENPLPSLFGWTRGDFDGACDFHPGHFFFSPQIGIKMGLKTL